MSTNSSVSTCRQARNHDPLLRFIIWSREVAYCIKLISLLFAISVSCAVACGKGTDKSKIRSSIQAKLSELDSMSVGMSVTIQCSDRSISEGIASTKQEVVLHPCNCVISMQPLIDGLRIIEWGQMWRDPGKDWMATVGLPSYDVGFGVETFRSQFAPHTLDLDLVTTYTHNVELGDLDGETTQFMFYFIALNESGRAFKGQAFTTIPLETGP